jgi:hypothetical protein
MKSHHVFSSLQLLAWKATALFMEEAPRRIIKRILPQTPVEDSPHHNSHPQHEQNLRELSSFQSQSVKLQLINLEQLAARFQFNNKWSHRIR